MATSLPVDIELNYRMLLSWQYDKIEFLGLPHLKDNRALRLGEIFTPLRFKLSPADERTLFLPKVLKDHKHLVVLGDPGCGKSTLVKQVTHSFSTSTPPSWTSHFGKLLPIPIILRDYRVGYWNNYEDMLRSFISKLDEGIRDLVTVEWLIRYLAKGQAIVLLDGVDEIGSSETRQRLRDEVIFPLVEKFPESYFILTSRIIGYEESPFDKLEYKSVASHDRDPLDYRFDSPPSRLWHHFQRCYVASFNDDDIEQFITRWYATRESDAEARREGVESLKRALAKNDRVRRLASNPSLITLIALIHRVMAHLPSGRVKLYDKITEAYLETIQNYRKLERFPASLEQMKRWLARVGWEMQSRRDDKIKGDLLVSGSEVQSWLQSAIADERDNAVIEATAFLDYITRRSGLLIPRGVDDTGNAQFSFVHLTFQEYFAALHLRGMAWDFGEVVNHCYAHLTHRYWHETILVLFEMLADMRGSGDRLVKILIEKLSQPDEQQAAAEIFSALLLDSESGLSPTAQQQAAEFAREQICRRIDSSLIEQLKQLPAERLAQWFEQPLIEQLQVAKPETLATGFFLVGDEFVPDWLQRIETELVGKRGLEKWQPDQLALIPLISAGKSKVIKWMVGRLPVHLWLAPITERFFLRTILPDEREVLTGGVSVAEFNFTLVVSSNTLSLRHQLLAQSALALAASGSQIVRNTVLVRQLDRPFAVYLDRSLVRYPTRSFYQYFDRYWARYLDPSLSRSLARYSARSWGRSLDRYLSQNLSAAISSPPLDSQQAQPHEMKSSLLLEGAAAEWLAFQPDHESERLATIAGMKLYLKAKDDWTRLLAINNLITLSAGTPELVRERNRLCDLAMTTPYKFTFPAELVEATKDKEWFNLPEIIAIIFLHKPGDPFLKPEWFDPKREESKFFLSPPREFFALAAEVLDPKGETELAKWR